MTSDNKANLPMDADLAQLPITDNDLQATEASARSAGPDVEEAWKSGNVAVVNLLKAGYTTLPQIAGELVRIGVTANLPTGLAEEVKKMLEANAQKRTEKDAATNRAMLAAAALYADIIDGNSAAAMEGLATGGDAAREHLYGDGEHIPLEHADLEAMSADFDKNWHISLSQADLSNVHDIARLNDVDIDKMTPEQLTQATDSVIDNFASHRDDNGNLVVSEHQAEITKDIISTDKKMREAGLTQEQIDKINEIGVKPNMTLEERRTSLQALGLKPEQLESSYMRLKALENQKSFESFLAESEKLQCMNPDNPKYPEQQQIMLKKYASMMKSAEKGNDEWVALSKAHPEDKALQAATASQFHAYQATEARQEAIYQKLGFTFDDDGAVGNSFNQTASQTTRMQNIADATTSLTDYKVSGNTLGAQAVQSAKILDAEAQLDVKATGAAVVVHDSKAKDASLNDDVNNDETTITASSSQPTINMGGRPTILDQTLAQLDAPTAADPAPIEPKKKPTPQMAAPSA